MKISFTTGASDRGRGREEGRRERRRGGKSGEEDYRPRRVLWRGITKTQVRRPVVVFAKVHVVLVGSISQDQWTEGRAQGDGGRGGEVGGALEVEGEGEGKGSGGVGGGIAEGGGGGDVRGRGSVRGLRFIYRLL